MKGRMGENGLSDEVVSVTAEGDKATFCIAFTRMSGELCRGLESVDIVKWLMLYQTK
jgi:hypothetical protein